MERHLTPEGSQAGMFWLAPGNEGIQPPASTAVAVHQLLTRLGVLQNVRQPKITAVVK
jgi:hypothetical protein